MPEFFKPAVDPAQLEKDMELSLLVKTEAATTESESESEEEGMLRSSLTQTMREMKMSVEESNNRLQSGTFLTESESDAYKVLFIQIYRSESMNVLLTLYAMTLITVQVSVIYATLSYYWGWNRFGGDVFKPEPINDLNPERRKNVVGVRCICIILLVFLHFKDSRRSFRLMKYVHHVGGNICGSLCAWLIALMGLLTAIFSFWIGLYLILAVSGVVDMMKDFAALAFILDIDDFISVFTPDFAREENSGTLPAAKQVSMVKYGMFRFLDTAAALGTIGVALWLCFAWLPRMQSGWE